MVPIINISIVLVLLSFTGCQEKNKRTSTAINELPSEPKPLFEQTLVPQNTPLCGPKKIPVYISEYVLRVYPVGSTPASQRWDELLIFMAPKNPQELVNKPSFKFNFTLFSSAYACQPGYYMTEQTITRFSITSDSYFSAEHPPGTELKQFFTAVVPHSGLSIDLSIYPSADISIAPTDLYLSLLQPPLELRQKFLITVEFADGSISESTTEEILFEPTEQQ